MFAEPRVPGKRPGRQAEENRAVRPPGGSQAQAPDPSHLVVVEHVEPGAMYLARHEECLTQHPEESRAKRRSEGDRRRSIASFVDLGLCAFLIFRAYPDRRSTDEPE
jgi:hypothetical protein